MILAEHLLQAPGENLISDAGSAWIRRTRFRVIHPSFAEFTAEMCRMVRNAVAVFDESAYGFQCPRLIVFEDSTEFLNVFRRELRRPAAAEARAKSVNSVIFPRVPSDAEGFAQFDTGCMQREHRSLGEPATPF